MPPLARTIATILVLAAPGTLGAQGIAPPQGNADRIQYAGRPQHSPGSVIWAAGEQPVVPAETPTPPGADSTPSHPVPPAAASSATSLLAAPGAEPVEPLPLPPPSERKPLALTPPGQAADTGGDRPVGPSSTVTVFGSLAVVLGVFFVVAWALRRVAPASSTALPGEVFEVLGRASTTGRQQVQLLRCGNKLLLVSVTQSGAETLTEITDPPEVDRLAGLCRQAQPNSATATFRQVFEQLAPRRAATGAVSRLWGREPKEDLSPGPRVGPVDDQLEIRHV